MPTQHRDEFIDFFFQWDHPTSGASFCILEWGLVIRFSSGWRGGCPLIFRPNGGPKSRKKFFWDCYLSPPPSSLPQRLDPALRLMCTKLTCQNQSTCSQNNNQGFVYLVCFHISLQCIRVDKYMSADCQQVYRCHHLGNNQVYRPLSE